MKKSSAFQSEFLSACKSQQFLSVQGLLGRTCHESCKKIHLGGSRYFISKLQSQVPRYQLCEVSDFMWLRLDLSCLRCLSSHSRYRVLAAEYPGSSIEWIRFRLWLWNDNSREWRRADLPSWHAWLSCHPQAGWNLPTKARGGQVDSTFHQISVCPCVTLWWRMLPQLQCLLYLRRWSEVLVWKCSRCLAAVWTIWSLNRLPLYKRLDWDYDNTATFMTWACHGMSWEVLNDWKQSCLLCELHMRTKVSVRTTRTELGSGGPFTCDFPLVTQGGIQQAPRYSLRGHRRSRRRREWYRYNRLMTKNEDAFKSVRLFNSRHMSLDWIWKQGFTCNALWPKDFPGCCQDLCSLSTFMPCERLDLWF